MSITEEVIKSAKMIDEMLVMQKTLNNAIMKEKGLTFGDEKFNFTTLKRAIIDEVGELNHELKGLWCWWKNTQAEPNNEKVLEELVDVWHFVMSRHYLRFEAGLRDFETDTKIIVLDGIRDATKDEWSKDDPIIQFLESFIDLDDMVCLTYRLGYEIEDVYREYLKKNKINFERLKNGY
jgi:dimeric dUTPase (all-alpha-NTP-PPase superfamily)